MINLKNSLILLSLIVIGGCAPEYDAYPNTQTLPSEEQVGYEPENWLTYCQGSSLNIAEEHIVKCKKLLTTIGETKALSDKIGNVGSDHPEFESEAAQEQQYWENEKEYQQDLQKVYEDNL